MDPSQRLRSKILTRGELLEQRADARRAAQSVVQCHGCFDIVHPGHVRHLQHAAKQGDVLLVTITADSMVGKGEGRPLFPQELRAENLAALDCVDWVYVNPHPTAVELLDAVQPDVYIKGREYETNDDPRFQAERESVEASGGRVVFSSGDVVFSSTALVAAMEHSADPLHARIRQILSSHSLDGASLDSIIESFAGTRVCVIGETLTDTYVFCDAPDVAGESPVMSLRPIQHTSFDGGAAIIARHLLAMGARPTLITGLPRTPAAEALRARLAVEGVDVRIIETEGPMLEKQRFLVGSQKVMKLDFVQPITLDASRQEQLITMACDAAGECDAAIVADFGNGLLTAGSVSRLTKLLRPRVDVLTGDVSGRRSSLLSMCEMDLLCPTEAELRDAVRDYDDSINAVVWRLLQQTGSKRAFVTMGAEGLTAFERRPSAEQAEGWANRLRGEHVPALVPHALDALGCGDAMLAAATLALARVSDPEAALAVSALIASTAAGAESQRLGNEVISAGDIRQGLQRLCDSKLEISTRRAGVRMVS